MMKVNIGDELTNPITGERGVVKIAPTDENGRLLVADLFIQPGGAVAGAHYHPAIEEAFTVVSGQVGFLVGDKKMIAPLGERIVVPVGVVHDWWNAGSEEAQVVVEIRPADRFMEMIANMFGLARDGKTNKKGMPNPLQLIVFGQEFQDVVIFTKPPRWVFKMMCFLLGPLARVMGYRGSYPRYLSREEEGKQVSFLRRQP